MFIANKTKLTGILTSERSDDEIQAELVDILGYDELDLVIHIVQQRRGIVENVSHF